MTPQATFGGGLISNAMQSAITTLGGRRVIDTRTFLVPAGESVSFVVDALGWQVALELVFEPAAQSHALQIEPKPEGGARIRFAKWENSLGTATKEPVELARLSDGQKLLFMAVHYVIGPDAIQGTVKLDLQFLVGF
jgi:hypothetical protein